jgi:RNA recognition motif-containing protein
MVEWEPFEQPGIDLKNPNINHQLYVENRAATTTADDLIKLFSKFDGGVAAYVAVDPTDQKLRGFGFVTMATQDGALAAIQSVHGRQMRTHALIVRQASAIELPGANRKAGKRVSATVGQQEPIPGD